jgi:hypothetical protein
MGKKGQAFLKKDVALFFFFCMLVVLISGCYTLQGAFDGAKKDWKTLTLKANEADQRLREVLW